MLRKIPIVTLVLLIPLVSCTERIEVELDSGYSRLIVYGEITTDTTEHLVKLSRSANYFSNNDPEPVSGALVELSVDDSLIRLTENPNAQGHYLTDRGFYGIPGKNYKLKISQVDVNGDGRMENYFAESFLPPVNPIDSVRLNYRETPYFSGWEVLVWAYDPADTKDFYSFRVYKNGILLTNILTEYFVQSDDFFNGNYSNGITAQFLNDDSETDQAFPGDTIIFEIDGITEGYYDFIIQAMEESRGRTPLFSGPPANVSSNLSQGALGYFTAYSIKRKVRIVPDYPSK